MKKIGKLFFIFLSVAILFRIILLIWVIPLPFASNGDLTRYEGWARDAHIYSYADTYTSKHLEKLSNNQPPGSIYVLSANYETYILVGKLIAKLTHTQAGSILWVNTFFLHIWMRIPSIVAELLLGVCAYFLVAKTKDDRQGLLTASLLWFNPVIFYNGTLWGQMDSLNNLFFLFALLLAFNRKYILSIFSYAISIYIKLSLLPLLPFYFTFLFFLSKRNIKTLSIGIISTLIAVVAATFPISPTPLQWLILNLPHLAQGELQNVTNAAFNFWWFVSCGPTCNYPPIINIKFLWISLNSWGYMLFFATTFPLLFNQIKKAKDMIGEKQTFLLFSLVAFAIFLFLPKMHDRYMYPLFPLFAVFIGLTKQKKIYLTLYLILSLFHFINLLYSWIPTYFPFFIMYQIIYSRLFDWLVSLGIVSAATLLYIKGYRFLFSVKIKP